MSNTALKIAKLQCETQLQSQVLSMVTDPLWSTILGFVAVHELRKRDLVGPVADDILYAGIIAVNTARTPGLTDLAGKGLNVVGEVATAAVGGAIATKLISGAGGAGAGAKAVKLLGAGKTALAVTGKGLVYLPSGMRILTPAELEKRSKLPAWKRFLGMG